ncbi:MAG: biopolymer transporter ExbD [Blastomonas sp.]
MAISMGGGGEETPMSDINTTPLVDVMLVLLIIFLIAIPVVIQTVDDLEIPVLEFEVTDTKPENILLSVSSTDAAGRSPGDDGFEGASPAGECRVYVNATPVDSDELLDIAVKRLESIIENAGGVENLEADDLPEVHIRGDINVPYRCVGGAIFNMQRAGFAKVGFISTPIAPTDIN